MIPGEDGRFEKVLRLADGLVARLEPRMRWMWGEALLGYALTELDAALGEDRYLAFTRAYCDYYLEHEPRVDQSDRAAPALVTYAMQKRRPGAGYARLTDKVLSYIRNGPRVLGEALNHLGDSAIGRLYPTSIWVDSLMMFGVFPARYASETGDADLLSFAARQPGLYASYLQDPDEGLWYHSYWVKAGRHHPKSKIFWGRGNGWVVAALPMILSWLPEDNPERPAILSILRRTSEALLPYQRGDGYFETVINRPGRTYRESSATALVASGWLEAYRRGWLDERFLEAGLKAFRAVADDLEEGPEGGLSMTEISGPTIPLPLFPYAGYKYLPRGADHPYGLAALILAAIQYRACLSAP